MRRLALLPHALELLEAHRRHRISPEVRLALCSRECADSPLQHANLAVDVVHTLNEQAGSLALAVDLALLLGAVLLAIALSARGVQREALWVGSTVEKAKAPLLFLEQLAAGPPHLVVLALGLVLDAADLLPLLVAGAIDPARAFASVAASAAAVGSPF